MTYFKEIKIDTNNATGDAFGRVRTSAPKTLFDAKQIYDNAPLFWDDQQVSGSGTASVHSSQRASSVLSVSNLTAGRRLRQTYQRFNYQPGKSLLALMTGILKKSGGGNGITKRIGYYDDNNGLFLECSNDIIRFVRRTNVTGTPVDNTVNQSAWNVDKMDGTGSSGITMDFTKTNIFVMDFEWLGVGRVRMGFNIDGVTYVAHEFLNANVLDAVYMSDPNLPLRYEIINDGTGAASEIECICTSVMSEGDLDPLGINRYASTNGTHVDVATENTDYALLGIRLKSGYPGTSVLLTTISIFIGTASDYCEWRIFFNPTVAGTFTYADETNSAVQIARGATTNTVTGGILIDGGHAFSSGNAGGATGAVVSKIENALRLGLAIDGTPDEIVLTARPINGSSNVDIEAGLSWRELL